MCVVFWINHYGLVKEEGLGDSGVIVFQLARIGSNAQKGLGGVDGGSWGQSHLNHIEFGRGVILQMKMEAFLLRERSNSGQAETGIYYMVGCYKGVTTLRRCKSIYREIGK